MSLPAPLLSLFFGILVKVFHFYWNLNILVSHFHLSSSLQSTKQSCCLTVNNLMLIKVYSVHCNYVSFQNFSLSLQVSSLKVWVSVRNNLSKQNTSYVPYYNPCEVFMHMKVKLNGLNLCCLNGKMSHSGLHILWTSI